ncbi:MAG: hypothetical protein Q9159_002834 [Coniocarpon cinnabarinum]
MRECRASLAYLLEFYASGLDTLGTDFKGMHYCTDSEMSQDYFFYGSLTDANNLASALGTDKAPALDEAGLYGFQSKSYGDDKALIDEGDEGEKGKGSIAFMDREHEWKL